MIKAKASLHYLGIRKHLNSPLPNRTLTKELSNVLRNGKNKYYWKNLDSPNSKKTCLVFVEFLRQTSKKEPVKVFVLNDEVTTQR